MRPSPFAQAQQCHTSVPNPGPNPLSAGDLITSARLLSIELHLHSIGVEHRRPPHTGYPANPNALRPNSTPEPIRAYI
eukprot:175194-Pyramimonas_sp.AAC.1